MSHDHLYTPANHWGLDDARYAEITHALNALKPEFSFEKFGTERVEYREKKQPKPTPTERVPQAPTKVERVYTYIRDHQPVGNRAICNATGLDHRAVSSILNKLYHRGYLAKQELPDSGGRLLYSTVPEKPYSPSPPFGKASETALEGQGEAVQDEADIFSREVF